MRESQRVTDRKGKVTDTPAHFLLLVHPFSSPLQPTNKSDINTMPEIIPFFIISPSPSKEIHHFIKCYIKNNEFNQNTLILYTRNPN
ncbi:hypothetical protein LFU01_00490 [Lysinibacillus fusiformis]|nr:hypothetical protein LFU01_00490 [Lysinibacillus fusiformis]